MQGIATSCQGLQLLMLGGSTIGAAPAGCSCQLECSRELRDAAVAAVLAWTDEHADRCMPLLADAAPHSWRHHRSHLEQQRFCRAQSASAAWDDSGCAHRAVSWRWCPAWKPLLLSSSSLRQPCRGCTPSRSPSSRPASPKRCGMCLASRTSWSRCLFCNSHPLVNAAHKAAEKRVCVWEVRK